MNESIHLSIALTALLAGAPLAIAGAWLLSVARDVTERSPVVVTVVTFFGWALLLPLSKYPPGDQFQLILLGAICSQGMGALWVKMIAGPNIPGIRRGRTAPPASPVPLPEGIHHRSYRGAAALCAAAPIVGAAMASVPFGVPLDPQTWVLSGLLSLTAVVCFRLVWWRRSQQLKARGWAP